MWPIARKRAVITGAACGIGAAIAVRLAQHGTHLCLVDRDAESLAEVAAQCRQEDVFVSELAFDLLAEGATDAIHDHLDQQFRGCDVLINNAGVCYYGSYDQMTADQLAAVVRINFEIPLELTHRLLPLLLAEREAHVVNMASMYGLFPTRRAAAYHAGKSGLIGFSLALRAEYSRYGLGVSCLCPGFTQTNLFATALTAGSQTVDTPSRLVATTPNVVADRVIRAIRHNRRLVPVTSLAWGAWLGNAVVAPLIDLSGKFSRRKRHTYARSAGKSPAAWAETVAQTPSPTDVPDRRAG